MLSIVLGAWGMSEMKQADGLELMIQEWSRDGVFEWLNRTESRIRRGGHARAGAWGIRDSGKKTNKEWGERKEAVRVERG